MKVIHSSDLQIGKAFGYFGPETAKILQDARQAVIRTLGESAVKNGASAVLIAGGLGVVEPCAPFEPRATDSDC